MRVREAESANQNQACVRQQCGYYTPTYNSEENDIKCEDEPTAEKQTNIFSDASSE